MAAVTGIYAISPIAGVNLYQTTLSINTGSTRITQNVMEHVFGSDGRQWIFGRTVKAQTSVATVSIGAAGSIVSLTTTSAKWMMNTAGGIAASTYCWIRSRTVSGA